MMAAVILAKSGYQVTTFEKRDGYSRNIQWALRQSVIDALGAIDPELAETFRTQIAADLVKGSVHISDDGSVKEHRTSATQVANPLNVPNSGKEMIAAPSRANVEAKVFEAFYPSISTHFQT